MRQCEEEEEEEEERAKVRAGDKRTRMNRRVSVERVEVGNRAQSQEVRAIS
jgi:hypothetical protein